MMLTEDGSPTAERFAAPRSQTAIPSSAKGESRKTPLRSH
jgi:hypothetical protein